MLITLPVRVRCPHCHREGTVRVVVERDRTLVHILHDDETYCEVNPDVELVKTIVEELSKLHLEVIKAAKHLLADSVEGIQP